MLCSHSWHDYNSPFPSSTTTVLNTYPQNSKVPYQTPSLPSQINSTLIQAFLVKIWLIQLISLFYLWILLSLTPCQYSLFFHPLLRRRYLLSFHWVPLRCSIKYFWRFFAHECSHYLAIFKLPSIFLRVFLCCFLNWSQFSLLFVSIPQILNFTKRVYPLFDSFRFPKVLKNRWDH